MSGAAEVRIRRMRAGDVERVLEIASYLRGAPHWRASVYAAAMNSENLPRRIALVVEADAEAPRNSIEGFEERAAGAKAQAGSAQSSARLKPCTDTSRFSGGVLPLSTDGGTEARVDHSPGCESTPWRVVGFAVASVVSPEAELETIAVAAEAQRRGVGERLLGALVEELRAERVAELLLEVRASNAAAIGFYRVRGFEEAGRRARYYAEPEEDAVLMRMKLA